MKTNYRRKFLSRSGKLVALGGITLSNLPPVKASDMRLSDDIVKFSDDIEPLVKLIENSSRAELLKSIAARIRKGTSYRQVLAGLLLAGIRNVQPRPSVGFKFHCVLVVNSCHLASLAGPDEDRWLPLFWALDYFKSSQKDEARRSGWKMPAIADSKIPSATVARKQFVEAMEQWDVEKADYATAGIARKLGSTEVFNLFARYAARDYRSIGHKAIYLANSWRTLQVIGWQHAEPVLRSLSFALLNHQGEPNPADNDLGPDRSWRENVKLVEQVPGSWLSGKLDHKTPENLFDTFRSGSPLDASQIAATAMKNGVSPQSIWDGVFLGAGELLMRQPGIIGLHGLTTANAMHFLWKTSSEDDVRKKILLQACSFNPQFRDSATGRGKLADASIGKLGRDSDQQKSTIEIPEILADISGNRTQAAQKLFQFLEQGGRSHDFVNQARRLLFSKGRDAHDYKFCSAVMEDYVHISPRWRNAFLATSVFNLRGSGDADNSLVKKIREVLE